LKGLYAKLAAGDAILGEAQVNRLAEILRAQDVALARANGEPVGELDRMDCYRSAALGLLIRDPGAAAVLIAGLDLPGESGAEHADSHDDRNDGNDGDEGGEGREGRESDMRAAADEGTDCSPFAGLATDRWGTWVPDRRGPAPTGPASGSRGPGPSSVAAQAVVHLHLDEGSLRPGARGVARVSGHGPMTLPEVTELLRHARVRILPELDPRKSRPADSYEFRGTLREAVRLLNPADVFPYGVATGPGLDVDHPEPFDPGRAPPEQTHLRNAAPLTRHTHRIKTHGGIIVRQLGLQEYVWRTPHRRYRTVDPRGTFVLDRLTGDDLFSEDPQRQSFARYLLAEAEYHRSTVS
jgi:hypothetical protein